MTITLSENVRQEKPIAFMVFPHHSIDFDYMIFHKERDARSYAMEQEEKADVPDDSWPIYALWASEWPRKTLSPPNENEAADLPETAPQKLSAGKKLKP